MSRKNRVHRALKVADAFPVDDANLVDPALHTRRQEFRDQIFDLTRIKRMQIQYAIYRNLDGL